MYPLAKVEGGMLLFTLGLFGVGWSANDPAIWQPLLVILALTLAISLRFSKKFRGYQFTTWIIAVVMAAMIYPAQFLHVGNLDRKSVV